MYREAEEQISKGLSPFARFLLAFFSGLFGLIMLSTAPDTDKKIYFYLFGGFCCVICLACIFKGRARQFLGSIIGLSLAVISLLYLGSEVFEGGSFFSARSEQSIFNAILFSIFFGLPGLSYVVKAKFGFCKKPEL